jgi:SH3 domain protein
MRTKNNLLLLLLAILLPSGAAAEVVYVSESLKAGIHQSESFQSTILTLIPSGTALEVLERKSNQTRVKTPDGVVGWVDARYLTAALPSSRRIEDLEDELLQTATELAAAREQAAELEFQLTQAETRAETQRLLNERAGIEKVESEPAAEPDTSDANASLNSETLRELQHVAEENQRLRQLLAELEAVQAMAVEHAEAEEKAPREEPAPYDKSGDASSLAMQYTGVIRWKAWQKILLASFLLLAFAAGAYLVDWEVRRRHGGFRV